MTDPPVHTMPLEGVLQDGPQIDLVPVLKLNWTAQVLASIVGALGAASVGAGIGPYLSRTASVPPEAIAAIADRCTTKAEHCDALSLAQPHMGAVAIVVGLLLMCVQGVVFYWTGTGPRKRAG
jgi:hypothetical protein